MDVQMINLGDVDRYYHCIQVVLSCSLGICLTPTSHASFYFFCDRFTCKFLLIGFSFVSSSLTVLMSVFHDKYWQIHAILCLMLFFNTSKFIKNYVKRSNISIVENER